MGKYSYITTDSDETEDTGSSIENIKKKKKKFSILKKTSCNLHKKKCQMHSRSEPEEGSELRSRSRSGSKTMQKLHGILKYYDKESPSASEEEDVVDSSRSERSKDRCLVGRVPRPYGAKPGRGGGVAIYIRKDQSAMQPQTSTSSRGDKRRALRKLVKKRSY